jgi:hypothetical protein
MSVLSWLRARRTAASVTTLAVLIAAPVAVAVIHDGFPVSNVNLHALDVWVTNAQRALAGRLNTQITELDGGVSSSAKNFDVLQTGNNLFVSNADQQSVSRIDPSFATLQQKIDTPAAAQVSFGGGRIAIVRPGDGALWILDATGPLQFDPKSPPTFRLGAGGVAVVGLDGTIAAASTTKHALYEFAAGSMSGTKKASISGSDPTVTLVGTRAVALLRGTLFFDDGSKVTPKTPVLRLQQPGPDRDTVLVATGDSLLQVASNGSQTARSAKITTPAVSSTDVAAPVVLGTCLHGAWSSEHRYLGVCDGLAPVTRDVAVGKSDAQLQFRVNQEVIALNNITDGGVWLVKKADIVDANVNWDQATPPSQDNSQKTDQTTSVPNFEQAVTNRSPENHPPVARPDELGARPGKTTILDVLANDTDPDGDVLTITSVSSIPDSAGKLELIQGNRALQFVPTATFSGTVSFRYAISDGRGGVADTNVDVAVRPVGSVDSAPVSRGTSAVTLEQGKTISYNVLGDWYDPDGDDLILAGASAPNALVRFSPDGLITYTQLGNELGPSTVAVQVSDGQKTTNGTLIVDIKAPGQAAPIGTPDFATTFVNQPVKISPLSNDLSPSGVPLTLGQVKPIGAGPTPTIDPNNNTVSIVSSSPGSFYYDYLVSAGSETSHGLIRVDVDQQPTDPPGPTAVKDVAYLRPNQPVTLPVLDNDVSPSGAVLGIQSVTIPAAAAMLSVQVLSGAVIKITAPSGMTTPVEFEYTISDGTKTSTAGVSVNPLPELTHHQAPIALDDAAKARVGDIASVSVLDNDYHPDGAQMHLDPKLVQANVGDGLAFVTGDQVRLQAPSRPGQYTVTYRIYDDFGESSTANVVFTVLPRDAQNNAAPNPQTINTRVFQGATLKVDVPLNGIDPDGDSVTLFSVGAGTLGEVADVTATSFSYQAYPDKSGTDSFTYVVHDAFGAAATGQINIGVIPRPATTLAPDAVGDQVAMRPGRVSSVPVLLNDSDPNGYPIHLAKKLLDVQKGILAVVSNDLVVVTAARAGTFSVHYQIDNGHGGTADAFLIVKVSADAPLQPPVAFDQSVDAANLIGKHTVDVDVLHDAQNPGGLVSELKVAAIGPNKSIASINPNGTVKVTLGATRQAVAYRLTNAIDNLSASAFIVVPAYSDSSPPHLKSNFKVPQNTSMNTAISWKLADILDVPSGRPVKIADPSSATAGRQAKGVSMVSGADTIVYTPEKGFRGTTVVTFKVTDTGNSDDPNATTIQFQVTVGDPAFRDVAPTFADQTIEIQPGEAAKTFDLRSATAHPNPVVIQELNYQNFTKGSGPIQASLGGSTVTMSTDVSTPVGTTTVVKFNVVLGTSFSVPGQLTIKVVASTRPLPQAVDDTEPNGRSSTTYTISPLANDFNPFADQGKPLTVTNVAFQGDSLGATGLTHTDSTVSVTTGTAKSGTITIIYTEQDATKSGGREVQGRITVVVISAPEPVTSFSLSNPGSQTVSVVFQAPVSSNGAPITGYTVRMAATGGTVTRTDCSPGTTCTFNGRTNGSNQTVDISATNNVGSTWSSTQTIIPYGTPATPTGLSLSESNGSASAATLHASWNALTGSDTGGAAITYEWQFFGPNLAQNSGRSGYTASNSIDFGVNIAGTYSFRVLACNSANQFQCGAWASSSPIDVPGQSGHVYDAGYVGYNNTDHNYYHYLGLCVSYLTPGTYNVALSNNTQGVYKTISLALPANGCVSTGTQGGTLTPAGSSTDWFQMQVLSTFLDTPRYQPWS